MTVVSPEKSVFDGSRRRFLQTGMTLGVTGVVGLTPRHAVAAAAKLSPGEIGYQTSPKGSARCELCVNWQAPNACKVVAGAISPKGWCGLFAQKL